MARRRAAGSLTDLGFRRREGGGGRKEGWMDGWDGMKEFKSEKEGEGT
jgi:hypothetical protein